MKNHNTDSSNYSFKTFLPLIIIFITIIALTIAKQILISNWNIQTLMADLMGFFFIVFGSFKIVKLKDFAEAYSTYDILAKKSKLYSLSYPFIELTLGIIYLLP